ncbi:MAG: histidine kinase [Verrucomicrobia bacterium]|nr:MAG: histidine kinase [Verrucomicrobiota bacterium]
MSRHCAGCCCRFSGTSLLASKSHFSLPCTLVALVCISAATSSATILWRDLGATLVHETGAGNDIIGGALRRDDTFSDTLYFKFHVDPISDLGTEEYFAGFQLFEGDQERLGVGNSLGAWAYSAFKTSEIGEMNKVFGDMDLRSRRRESSAPGVYLPYEFPRRGIERTIVFKVQYVAGADDLVTVWLNPDLSASASEASQPEELTTHFKADASFSEIHLRHGGGGGGWTFSDMAIATSFNDFVAAGYPQFGGSASNNPAGEGLSFKVWQRAQGLPQESVHALTQTRDGYIWIGNDDGVARFDGARFVTFGLREGIRIGSVRVLFEDNSGALWMGSAGGGLTRWSDGAAQTFTAQNGLPSDTVTALAEDNDGRLWVGTEGGLTCMREGKAATVEGLAEVPGASPNSNAGQAGRLPYFKGKPITSLFKDRQGTMWIGAMGAGIFSYQNGKLEHKTDPTVETLLQDPHCLLVDKAGRIWVGAGDDFVLCHEAGQWRRYRIPRHLTRPYINGFVEEPDGTVWAASVSEGLFEFRAGKLRAVNASSGLSDNFIESLMADREGNLWVGTRAGLNRVRHGNLTILGQNEGLGYGPVHGLAEIAPGIIWAAKPNDGLYLCEGRSFSRVVGEEWSRQYPELNCLLVGRDGACWMGESHGLFRVPKPKEPVSDPEMAALAGLNVLTLSLDAEGDLWAGTREGELWQMRGKSWSRQTNVPGDHPVVAVVPAQVGGIWIGTRGGGLYRWQNGVVAHFDKRNGLLSSVIRALHEDGAGTLWIGTVGGGLSRLREGKLVSFTMREGLPDDTISQILEDNYARLWLGTDRGIAYVAKNDLQEVAAGKATAIYPQVYGRPEGMPSEECTGGFSPAGLRSQSGQLWFSTLKGIVVADPRPRASDVPVPNVVLEEVLVDGVAQAGQGSSVGDGSAAEKTDDSKPASHSPTRPLSRSQSLRLPPGRHRIEFHYTGLSFAAPERMRFRYRLEPLDTDWVDAGLQRSVPYDYLPPGNYEFRVSARNNEGSWNESGTSLTLTVMPHFWQAKWVIGLSLLGLALSAGGAVRIVEKKRHRRHLKNLEQERAIERERARIAQDLHDDLGSSLTRISLLSDLVKGDKKDPEQVEAQADKIQQSSMQAVRGLEQIVWALRPGSDTLQSLVEYIAHTANELFEGDHARCRLDLPAELPARSLPPEARYNIFLIVKEALTNALKHASADEVRVLAKTEPHWLEIIVQDNGHGFDTSTQSLSPVRRHGLGNMRSRAQEIGARLRIESAVGKGTSVRLVMDFADGDGN